MRGGGFYYEHGEDGQISGIRWATMDRETGATTSKSDILSSFETVDGETFSLIPSATKPWFKFEDTGGNCLHGRLKNYPGQNPDAHFKTNEIVSVTTQSGEVIPTLLAFTSPPYVGSPVVALTAQEFGQFFAGLISQMIKDEPDGESVTTYDTDTERFRTFRDEVLGSTSTKPSGDWKEWSPNPPSNRGAGAGGKIPDGKKPKP